MAVQLNDDINNPTAFDELQSSLVTGTNFNQELLLDALMTDPGSVESYSTFYRGLVRNKFDATELLTISSSLAVQYGSQYLMYMALALRFNANPNTYVYATFDIDGVQTQIPVHLAKYLWDSLVLDDSATTFTDDNEIILDVLALLSLSGLDGTLPVSDPQLLNDNGIDATAFVTDRPEFGYTVYETFDYDSELGKVVAKSLRYYEKAGGNLQLAYGTNLQQQNHESKRIDRDVKLLGYAMYLDLPEILTVSNLHEDIDNYRKVIFFQDVESFTKLLPTMIQLGIIGGPTSHSPNAVSVRELLLKWAVEYYALEIMLLLLDGGFKVHHNLKNLTIERARHCCEPYPAQCQVLNRMLVEYSRHGYLFDNQQLQQILQHSPITYEAVSIAKPSTPPAPTIETTITKKHPQRYLIADRVLPSSPNSPVQSIHNIQEDMKFSHAKLSTMKLPQCSNESTLSKPIEEYSVVDRVTYSDGLSTWCLTSEYYPELLKSGINPWVVNPDGTYGQPLPKEVMAEIAEKYDAIKCNRLLNTDEGIMGDRQVAELYRFAESYGVPRERFYALTARDFQVLADIIASPQSRVVIDQSSPILAVRDFARLVLSEARYAADRVGNILAKFVDR